MSSKAEVPVRPDHRVIDSRRLLYFYHVAQAGRFTAAEAIMGVAQSAISRQIQQLESELGVQLLERTGHGARLTPHGKILFRRAETLLKDMETTLDELEESKRRPLGSVSIAAPPSFMSTHMGDVVMAFAEMFPNVRIRVVEASTGGVYTLLAQGHVDMAIVLNPGNASKLSLRELLEEPLFLVAGAGHESARLRFVTPGQITKFDLLIPASLHGTRALLQEYFAAEGLEIPATKEVDSLPLTKQLLGRGDFCTLLPKSTCAAEINNGSLIARPLRPSLTRTLYVARLRDREMNPILQHLMECVMRAVQMTQKPRR